MASTPMTHVGSTPVPQVVATLSAGVVTSDTPVLLADDLGFTRGDGVFDATRVRLDAGGEPVVDHLERHLARFAHSIELMEGEAPDLDAWRATIADAVSAWQVPGEAVLKIMWARGLESFASQPTGVLTITPLGQSQVDGRRGIRVATLDRGYASDAFTGRPWLLGGAKTLSYAINVAVKREATRRGADDVLFTSTDGYCLEGPTSSLIARFGDRLVTTPTGATGILASITQDIIFDEAERAGHQVARELMTPQQVLQSDGAWLVSSVRGSAPITHLDGVELRQDAAFSRQVSDWAGF